MCAPVVPVIGAAETNTPRAQKGLQRFPREAAQGPCREQVGSCSAEPDLVFELPNTTSLPELVGQALPSPRGHRATCLGRSTPGFLSPSPSAAAHIPWHTWPSPPGAPSGIPCPLPVAPGPGHLGLGPCVGLGLVSLPQAWGLPTIPRPCRGDHSRQRGGEQGDNCPGTPSLGLRPSASVTEVSTALLGHGA